MVGQKNVGPWIITRFFPDMLFLQKVRRSLVFLYSSKSSTQDWNFLKTAKTSLLYHCFDFLDPPDPSGPFSKKLGSFTSQPKTLISCKKSQKTYAAFWNFAMRTDRWLNSMIPQTLVSKKENHADYIIRVNAF